MRRMIVTIGVEYPEGWHEDDDIPDVLVATLREAEGWPDGFGVFPLRQHPARIVS